MPDSVEMPAAVSTTMRCASAIQPATVRRSSLTSLTRESCHARARGCEVLLRSAHMPDHPTSYHSPKVQPRQINGKGGRALVVREPIAKGELVVVWGGEAVPASALDELSPA